MNRREFLIRIGGTVIAVPWVLQGAGCGDNGNPAGQSTTQWDVTSTADTTFHSHTITLLCTQLTSAGDVMYTSTSSGGHFHTLTLTPVQLATIAAGGTVTQASNADGTGHGHSWAIQKPAGTC